MNITKCEKNVEGSYTAIHTLMHPKNDANCIL